MSHTSVEQGPVVSVVVISFNDVARLPRAIASVQRQTLRSLEIIVVDDASTDATEDVVRELAANDPRIRYERLSENSGGCSAPRNRGLELARAPWVMFCDSDDEYERHACTNLLEAAESTGADIVCGTAERVDIRTGKARRWRPELHDAVQVADGLGDLPGLLYDTISVNKIYRLELLRQAGLRFPEGLLFEDQLFTLEAMAAARRLAVIPETVYRWYVDRLSDEPSITQRRNEARNVESRIEINRRIDDFLARHPDPRLRREKDRKFLRHDLYLYLSSMLEVDDETATLLMDRLVPYVAVVDVSPAWELRPGLRIAIYHLLQRDLEGVRAAMRFVRWASVVDRPVVAVDGREYWGCRHLVEGPGARGIDAERWLDVTEVGLLTTPFSQRRYLHRVESVDVTPADAGGPQVVVTGSSVDYDGALADADRLELRWEAAPGRPAAVLAAEWVGDEGPRRLWRASGVPTAGSAPIAAADRGSLVLAVSAGGVPNATAVRVAGPQAQAVEVPGPGGTVLGLAPSANGGIGWSVVRGGSPADAHVGAVPRAWRGLRIRLARRVGRLLPARPLVIVDAGRRTDPDVRAVARALGQRHPELTQVWVRRDPAADLPAGAIGVERGSVRHAWLQARAAARLQGEGAEAAVGCRSGAVVMAIAPTPVHRVGLDDPTVLTSRELTADVRRRGRSIGLLAVPTAAAGEVLAPALHVRGARAAVGLPRLDSALAVPDRDVLRRGLDLPTDRPVLVHAPLAPDRSALDVEAWAGALGGRVYLVVAAGAPAVSTRLRHAVRALAADEDLASFIAAADLVVSDYSPRIGDAVAVGRPVVLFQPDRDVFLARTCGVYPGLDDVGPVVVDQRALHDEVERWLRDPVAWDLPWRESRSAWGSDWVGIADGRAAERAADALAEAIGGAR